MGLRKMSKTDVSKFYFLKKCMQNAILIIDKIDTFGLSLKAGRSQIHSYDLLLTRVTTHVWKESVPHTLSRTHTPACDYYADGRLDVILRKMSTSYLKGIITVS